MKTLILNYGKLKAGGIVLLAASLPLHVHVSSIIIIALTALTLLKIVLDKKVPWKGFTVVGWLFALLFLLELLSLTYTSPENFKIGFAVIERHQSFVLLPLIFADYFPTNEDRDRIFLGLIAMIVVSAIVAVITNMWISVDEYGTLFHEWRFSHERITEPLGIQAVYYSLMISVLVAVMVDWILGGKFGTRATLVMVILTALLSLLSVALGARTVTVSLVIAAGLVTLSHGRRLGYGKTLAILTGGLIVVVTFVAINPVVKTRFLDMLNGGSHYDSYFARTNIWKPGMEAILENPLLGVGIGDAQTELDRKFIEHSYTEGVQVYNMHNEYLQLWLEIGLPGLIVWLMILTWQSILAIRRGDMVYLSFVLIFAIGSMTESLLSRNKGIILFILFSLIFNSSVEKGGKSDS